MPRQKNPLPSRAGRFTYWNIAGICPQPPDELCTFAPTWVQNHSRELSQKAFRQHLQGSSCNEPGCSLDTQLQQASPADWPFLALRRYVQSDKLWKQDAQAQKELKTLSAQEKKLINGLHAKTWSRRAQASWGKLLKQIATDQISFEEIITQKLSGSMTEAERSRYKPYSRQRQYLLGNNTSLPLKQVLHQRGKSISQLSRPTIPRRNPLDSTITRSMFDSKGELIDYDQQGTLIDQDIREQQVFHWFGHALRNLSRHINGNAPLPFQDSCCARCIRQRNKLA